MEIVKIPEHKYDDVIRHLRDNFFPDEPLNLSMGLCKPGEPHELLEKHSLATLKDQLSLMALDTATGKIAGVALNGILHRDDIKNAVSKLETMSDEKFKTIFSFLYEQNLKIDIFSRYGVENVFECRILSVDSNYRGFGLAKRLLEHSLKMALENNFKIFKEDATGLFSQKVATSLGIETILEVKYNDYMDSAGNLVFNVPAPHEKLRIMVKDLSVG